MAICIAIIERVCAFERGRYRTQWAVPLPDHSAGPASIRGEAERVEATVTRRVHTPGRQAGSCRTCPVWRGPSGVGSMCDSGSVYWSIVTSSVEKVPTITFTASDSGLAVEGQSNLLGRSGLGLSLVLLRLESASSRRFRR